MKIFIPRFFVRHVQDVFQSVHEDSSLLVQKMSQERKVPKIEQLRTVKSIVSAACQKFVENMELFTHKIRTFKEEPQNEIL